jgi:hypothetical protein
MNNYTDENTVDEVIDIFQKQFGVKGIVDHNYTLAKRFYSYENLRRKPRFILTDFFGEEIRNKALA